MPAPLARPLSHDTYDRLVLWLQESALPPDTRLPSEHELAQRFAVSRPVLRQALARLRLEGHVYARRGSGTYTQGATDRFEISYAMLDNIPDVRRFLEFRCSLEGEVAAFAAQYRSADDLAIIERARRGLLAAIAAGQPGLDEDVALHGAIARASGNRFFVTTLTAIAEQTRFTIRLTRELTTKSPTDRQREVMQEHGAICNAIAASDPTAARQRCTRTCRVGSSDCLASSNRNQ